MLYSVRQDSTTTWAFTREPDSSTLSNSSLTRPLKLLTKGIQTARPQLLQVGELGHLQLHHSADAEVTPSLSHTRPRCANYDAQS